MTTPPTSAVDRRAMARAIVTILVVEGAECDSCAARVRDALASSSDDVLAAEVDLERCLATVYSRAPLDHRRLNDAVRRTGEQAGQRYAVSPFATVIPRTDVLPLAGRSRANGA